MRVPWLRYGEIMEITIRDSSGAKIETIRFNLSDKKRVRQVINILYEKYNLDLSREKKDKDIDWLDSDF